MYGIFVRKKYIFISLVLIAFLGIITVVAAKRFIFSDSYIAPLVNEIFSLPKQVKGRSVLTVRLNNTSSANGPGVLSDYDEYINSFKINSSFNMDLSYDPSGVMFFSDTTLSGKNFIVPFSMWIKGTEGENTLSYIFKSSKLAEMFNFPDKYISIDLAQLLSKSGVDLYNIINKNGKHLEKQRKFVLSYSKENWNISRKDDIYTVKIGKEDFKKFLNDYFNLVLEYQSAEGELNQWRQSINEFINKLNSADIFGDNAFSAEFSLDSSNKLKDSNINFNFSVSLHKFQQSFGILPQEYSLNEDQIINFSINILTEYFQDDYSQIEFPEPDGGNFIKLLSFKKNILRCQSIFDCKEGCLKYNIA